MMASCNSGKPQKISDTKVNELFKSSEWQRLPMTLSESADKREFVEQNQHNPKAWETALGFLRDSNLMALPLGRHDLQNGVYATVSEYVPKDPEHFEAHQKFIDVQYVATGKEMIEVSDASRQKPSIPYDESKDVRFYDSEDFTRLMADSSTFFIFFPNDAHKPGMNIGQNDTVRKIVVKIPYSEW